MAGFLAERLKKNEKLSLLLQLIIEVRVTFFLHSTFAGCVCVKLLPDSMIPPHALKGHQAVLKCNYDLEGDNLYSVKWYFNQKEFYRYIPTDNPKVTIFNHHQGVRVNVSTQCLKITQIVAFEFWMLALSSKFCHIKSDQSCNTVWPKFRSQSWMRHFGGFSNTVKCPKNAFVNIDFSFFS